MLMSDTNEYSLEPKAVVLWLFACKQGWTARMQPVGVEPQ
jgi:hypothetical protein